MTASPIVDAEPVRDGRGAARRRELGRCLRSYRDLVSPGQVGLPAAAGRRRAPGLRREEVAALAGVGVTWYTWLEQGRVATSDEVIDAVARVLGIDATGREHLRALARPRDEEQVDPGGLRPLLESWSADPAALLDARSDVVAANARWTGRWGPVDGRHVLTQLLAPPPSGDDDGDGDDVTALVGALARRLRMATDRDPTDARLLGVRGELGLAAPDLGPLWACRGVGAFGRPVVRIDGRPRVAYLLGEVGAPAGGPAVLVLARVDSAFDSGAGHLAVPDC